MLPAGSTTLSRKARNDPDNSVVLIQSHIHTVVFSNKLGMLLVRELLGKGRIKHLNMILLKCV